MIMLPERCLNCDMCMCLLKFDMVLFFYGSEGECLLFACIFVNFLFCFKIYFLHFVDLYILLDWESFHFFRPRIDIDWSCQCMSNLYWFISLLSKFYCSNISINISQMLTHFYYYTIQYFFYNYHFRSFLQYLLRCMVRVVRAMMPAILAFDTVMLGLPAENTFLARAISE